jgi:hypothetical protein
MLEVGEYWLARGRESENLTADAGCAASLDLVRVAKEGYACTASSIIELAAREHAESRRLAGIDVADYSDAHLHHLLDAALP